MNKENVLSSLFCLSLSVLKRQDRIPLKNSLKPIKLYPVEVKLSLVQVSSCCIDTETMKDDPYQTTLKNSLKLVELTTINRVTLV